MSVYSVAAGKKNSLFITTPVGSWVEVSPAKEVLPPEVAQV